jgi:hypothetical protein
VPARTLEDSIDPRSGAIYIRRRLGSGVTGEESVLAHELTHALEYQSHLQSAGSEEAINFDQLEADRALVEGPAVLVQYRYAEQYLGFRGTLGTFLALFGRAARRALRLPRVLLADALFPYVDGTRFVSRLYDAGGWRAVDEAERSRPMTTQIVLTGRRSLAKGLGQNDRQALGRTWQAEPSQSIGAYDTAVLLTPGSLDRAESLVRFWRGGSLRLWNDVAARRVTRCRRPCAAHFALLARWQWASASVAKSVARDLRSLLLPVGLRSLGRGRVFKTRLGSYVVISARHSVTTAAFAPLPSQAVALISRP